ncbi:hypothetical protein DPMN_010540 [Dreissena polymorpha]|uniref:Uncharacterized protein n=1 Tax=Dreissena polymorpha TaxID=45954 RepID=A0A9D4RZ68_DREPO|nr:hypothetical protein DPMN_010540 [Dreissena polymorpha]
MSKTCLYGIALVSCINYFICHDIDWENLTVYISAKDKEGHQALLDLSVDFNLTQVHDKPTSENTLLDLILQSPHSLNSEHLMLLGCQIMKKSVLTQTPNRSMQRGRPDIVTCFLNQTEIFLRRKLPKYRKTLPP